MRELDRAIAELLGYTAYHYDKDYAEQCYYMLMNQYSDPAADGWQKRKTEAEAWNDCPQYSEDGNAMLELDAEMKKRGYALVVETMLFIDAYYKAYYWNEDSGKLGACVATEMPEAVAKAAYRALTGEEWKGDAV